jgi:hypothetical protein
MNWRENMNAMIDRWHAQPAWRKVLVGAAWLAVLVFLIWLALEYSGAP